MPSMGIPLGRHLKLDTLGPHFVFSLQEMEDAAVHAFLAGPAPFQMKGVVGISLFRADVSERLAADVQHAVIGHKSRFSYLLPFSQDHFPAREVLAVEQFGITGTSAGKGAGQEGNNE